MKDYQKQFIEFAIEKKVISFGDFTLKSGRKSPYFFNAGLFNSGYTLSRLGQFYAAALMDNSLSYDILFGPAYKGIPIVSSTVIALAEQYQLDIPYCFNRKEAKDHGEGGNLVGGSLQGKRVLFIDDVITAGTAIRESMPLLQTNQASLAGVLIALDRQEKGRNGDLSAVEEISQQYQCPVISIITLDNLMHYLQEKPELAEHAKRMENYRKAFSANA